MRGGKRTALFGHCAAFLFQSLQVGQGKRFGQKLDLCSLVQRTDGAREKFMLSFGKKQAHDVLFGRFGTQRLFARLLLPFGL